MSDITTVTLDGGELKVEGLGGQNTIIVNRGAATLYVSIYPDIVPDGDNVAAIPTGGAMNLHGTNGTVYLLGTGKVQLTGTDIAWLPISSGGSSGGGGSTGGGVSQEYVDNGDSLTLQSAKKYTDTTKTVLEEKIDEVRGEIPDIPESLPADGGNAETAEKLATARTINGVSFDGSEDIEIGISRSLLHNSTNARGWLKAATTRLQKSYHTFIKGLFLVTGDSFIDSSIFKEPIGNGLLTVGITIGSSPYNILYSVFIIENNYGVAALNPNNFKLLIRDDPNNSAIYEIEIWVDVAAYSRISFICLENLESWDLSDRSTISSLPDEYEIISCKQWNNAEVADLKAYIGYTDSDIYGLEADFENNKFTRLAGAVGKNPGADFNSIRAFGGRRRCELKPDGSVYFYRGDDGYDYNEDGWHNSAYVSYNVMVEQPKFYYKVVPLKTEKIDGADGYHLRKARYYISDTPKPGFKIHPAFIQNGVEVDKIYLSAYEGNIMNMANKAQLINDEQTANFDIDILFSIKNVKPASGTTQALTRANARKLAQNIGAGWGITTIQTASATELLMLIEYATFNMQAALGVGNTAQAANAENIKPTGRTSILGNASGVVTGEDGIQFISYRGEENFYGNIWTWIDGANNLNDTPISGYGKLYVADHDFKDDTAEAPYEDTGIRPCNVNGYVSAFGYSEKYDWLFIPTEDKGNSALPVGDYCWNANPGWRTAVLGGCCSNGAGAGAFFWSLDSASSDRYWSIGGRLVYVPGKIEEVTAND